MGRTNKCDLKEEEFLAEAVRKFPCLYDKSCKEYREKDRVANAWKKGPHSNGAFLDFFFLILLINNIAATASSSSGLSAILKSVYFS